MLCAICMGGLPRSRGSTRVHREWGCSGPRTDANRYAATRSIKREGEDSRYDCMAKSGHLDNLA